MVTEQTSIYCPHCHKHTALSVADGRKYESVVGDYIKSGESIFTNRTGMWWIGVCNSCSNCVLVRALKAPGGYAIHEIYPHPLPKPLDGRIPDFIKKDVEEANNCLSIGANKAATGLARLILQLICLDKGATVGKELYKQIEELSDKRVITDDIKEWAHSVRYVGNDALHPNKDSPKIEKEDAEDIINLVEQMIHILYIAPAIAKEKQNKFKKEKN